MQGVLCPAVALSDLWFGNVLSMQGAAWPTVEEDPQLGLEPSPGKISPFPPPPPLSETTQISLSDPLLLLQKETMRNDTLLPMIHELSPNSRV